MNIVYTTARQLAPEWLRRVVRRIRARPTPGDRRRELLRCYKRILRNNATPYEPIRVAGHLSAHTREWQTRWALIRQTLEDYSASSVLDIGCAEGWFLRMAAEEIGCFAIGVEFNNAALWPAELARIHDDVERCAIVKAKVDAQNIRNLPKVDAVICLSVVHHVIRSDGIAGARAFVASLSTRCEKVLIFEMGTSEERSMSWAKDMPAMPDGQEQFIRQFLESAGVQNVRQIGCTPSLRDEADRVLFVGEPGLRHRQTSLHTRVRPK